MFDIGFTELFVVALVGLVVLGPKRLPEVARTAGQWLGRLRRFMADVKQDFDHELQQAELAELRSLKQELDETRRTMEETSGKLMRDVSAIPDEASASTPPSAGPSSGAPSSAGTSSGTPSAGPAPKRRATRGKARGGGRRKKSASKQPNERNE